MALSTSGSAIAGHVDLSAGIGVPAAPVYVKPAPVYVAPQPAVVAYPGYGYDYHGGDDDDRARGWRLPARIRTRSQGFSGRMRCRRASPVRFSR
ncbi:hypothetical protein [Burkholderia sp. BCC0405]|uniref:hypothetical protein n=1 Tax=Burkholderia sp. BCC0405 TaxID=2676298 RepID=UPI001FC8076D|nr:hypothetical protein [Burkholderia sp. BCC0405]